MIVGSSREGLGCGGGGRFWRGFFEGGGEMSAARFAAAE